VTADCGMLVNVFEPPLMVLFVSVSASEMLARPEVLP
jgi:hypothetical protein